MVYLGIDPGLKGAAALIVPIGWPGIERGAVIFADTPILKTTKSDGGAKTIYDEAQMVAVLEGWKKDFVEIRAVIEQVHAMPKQGVSSCFTFGMGYGIWLGVLAALKIPSRRVTPQRWKKDVLADGPKTDQATVAFAGRLYPDIAPQLRGPRGALSLGRADALLIAHWGVGEFFGKFSASGAPPA